MDIKAMTNTLTLNFCLSINSLFGLQNFKEILEKSPSKSSREQVDILVC